MHLARHAPHVSGKVVVHRLGGTGQRRGVHQDKVGILDRQPFFQQVQHTLALDHLVVLAEDTRPPISGVAGLELVERFRLGRFEKLPEPRGIQRQRRIEVAGMAKAVSTTHAVSSRLGNALPLRFTRGAGQAAFDGLFQRFFRGVAYRITHDCPLTDLDFARDCRVDQGGFVFFKLSYLVLLDLYGIVDSVTAMFNMICNFSLLLIWRDIKIHVSEIFKCQILSIADKISGNLKRMDVARGLQQIAKEIWVYFRRRPKDDV